MSTPRRTRSGKLLSQEGNVVPASGSVARTSGVGLRPKSKAGNKTARTRRTKVANAFDSSNLNAEDENGDETNEEAAGASTSTEDAVPARASRARRSGTGPRPKPGAVARTTRIRRARGASTEQNVENGNIENEVMAGALTEMDEEEEILAPTIIDEENLAPSEVSTTVEVTEVDDSDTIEIVSETVNDSVIDLTDDTTIVTSPLRLGGHWANTPSFLARIPPNPWFTPRPMQPPITVDLTDSPADAPGLDTTTSDLETTDTPGSSGGVSVQCPVCLDSLGTIKRSGAGMVSTVCGHIFCSRCLPASLRASGRCPSCRRMIGTTEYHKIFI